MEDDIFVRHLNISPYSTGKLTVCLLRLYCETYLDENKIVMIEEFFGLLRSQASDTDLTNITAVESIIASVTRETNSEFKEAGTGRQSAAIDCNDITSVFALLAFLFALLNFVLNMNRRRKRSPGECEEFSYHLAEDTNTKEASLAVYAMYRGMINFLDTWHLGHPDTCRYRKWCEAAHVAGTRGQHGTVIAVIGGYKAATWIEDRGLGTRAEVMRAVTRGLASGCDDHYTCPLTSEHYRSPSTRRSHIFNGTNINNHHVIKNLFSKIHDIIL